MHATGKRLLRLLLITIITLAITFVGFEVIVRAVPMYPDRVSIPNPLYGWEYPPNGGGTWVSTFCPGEFVNYVQFNSHGLHDRERTFERTEGVRRVMLLGDSMIAAHEVQTEQMVQIHLERLLNEAAGAPGSHEVLAVGHFGYGVDLSLRYYEEVAHRYQPDVVVFVFQPHNDFDNSVPELRGTLPGYPAPYYSLNEDGSLTYHPIEAYQPTLSDRIASISRAYALLEMRIGMNQTAAADAARTAEDLARLDELRSYSWDLTFALVDALRDRVEADGTRFLVAVDRSVIAVDQRAAIHEAIGSELDELGITHLSLMPAMDAADSPDNPVMYMCDSHWTAYGHQVIAQALLPLVQQALEG